MNLSANSKGLVMALGSLPLASFDSVGDVQLLLSMLQGLLVGVSLLLLA